MSHLSLRRGQVLFAALLFATGGVAIKLTDLSVWQIAGMRSGLAVLFLLCLGPAWRNLRRRDTWVVAIGYAAVMILFVAATRFTTSANAIFLQSTSLLWVLLLSPLLLREPLERRDLRFGAGVGLGMMLLLLGTPTPLRTAPDPLIGNALGAVAGVAWALTLIGLRALARRGDDAPAEGAVTAGNILAFAFCLPMMLPLGASDLTLPALGALLYLGFVQIGVAYVFLTRGVRGLPAVEVALLLLMEPVLNAVLAWWWLAERPTLIAGLGCLLIAATTALRTWQSQLMPESEEHGEAGVSG